MLEIIPLLLYIGLGILLGQLLNKKSTSSPTSQQLQLPPIHVQAPNDPRIDNLINIISEIPHKVLESITSSSNNQKGRLGELIGYLHLNSRYDRLIALRDITDFLAIRFPKDGKAGSIDFIDVKNGPNARLTKDQVSLKNLIKDGKVNFYSFKVDTSPNSSDTTDES